MSVQDWRGYQTRWLPGDGMSQGISRHDIDWIFPCLGWVTIKTCLCVVRGKPLVKLLSLVNQVSLTQLTYVKQIWNWSIYNLLFYMDWVDRSKQIKLELNKQLENIKRTLLHLLYFAINAGLLWIRTKISHILIIPSLLFGNHTYVLHSRLHEAFNASPPVPHICVSESGQHWFR